MTTQPLVQTDSFIISFDDSMPSARRRAVAIAASCEGDLATLRNWFAIPGAFGSSDKITVSVCVPGNPRALADNSGYHSVAYGTLIQVGSFEGPTDQDLSDEFARGMFVAELAELCMDVLNNRIGHTAWESGHSDSEALSAFCAERMYFDACYRHPFGGFPRSRIWLGTEGWPDFVTASDPSDTNFASFGVGILFIAFLVDQLGFPIQQVIRADGATLEDKFHALTGRAGGFGEFTALLSQFFSPATASTLRTDFPFPLLAAANRTLGIVSSQERVGPPAEVDHGSVELQLPFPCQSAVEAHWTTSAQAWHVHYSALPRGFANPQFVWRVRDANNALYNGDTGFDDVLPLIVGVRNPARPNDPPAASVADVHLRAAAAYADPPGNAQDFGSHLDLWTDGGGGDVLLTVTCDANDAVSIGRTSETAMTIVATLETQYDDDYVAAVQNCRRRGIELIHKRFKPDPLLQVLPDPAPDFARTALVVRALIAREHQARIDRDNELASDIRQLATDYLHIPVEVFDGKPAQL